MKNFSNIIGLILTSGFLLFPLGAHAESLPEMGTHEFDQALDNARNEMLTFKKKIGDLEYDLVTEKATHELRAKSHPSESPARLKAIAELEASLKQVEAEKAARFGSSSEKLSSDLEEMIIKHDRIHTQYTNDIIPQGGNKNLKWPTEMFEAMDKEIQAKGMEFLKTMKPLKVAAVHAHGKAGKFGALGAAVLVPVAAEAIYGNSSAEAKTFDARELPEAAPSPVEVAPAAEEKDSAAATLGI